jgi:hypothetical protein
MRLMSYVSVLHILKWTMSMIVVLILAHKLQEEYGQAGEEYYA